MLGAEVPGRGPGKAGFVVTLGGEADGEGSRTVVVKLSHDADDGGAVQAAAQERANGCRRLPVDGAAHGIAQVGTQFGDLIGATCAPRLPVRHVPIGPRRRRPVAEVEQLRRQQF